MASQKPPTTGSTRRTTRSQQALVPGGFQAPTSPEEETFIPAPQSAGSTPHDMESSPPDIPYPPDYEYEWAQNQQLIKVDWQLVRYAEDTVDPTHPIEDPLGSLKALIPQYAESVPDWARYRQSH